MQASPNGFEEEGFGVILGATPLGAEKPKKPGAHFETGGRAIELSIRITFLLNRERDLCYHQNLPV